jgi:hypothetical protein
MIIPPWKATVYTQMSEFPLTPLGKGGANLSLFMIHLGLL